MKGYFEDPAATSEALRGGWMHTGDAAVVHPDVEIRDRFKDVIISGGENILPWKSRVFYSRIRPYRKSRSSVSLTKSGAKRRTRL